ncbi:hypothetical protein DXZ75_26585 [Streptomyces sp. AcE210]|nr:hypothetical protein DXZ75_26585 [Streptomyces sp. AcE210]
MYSAIVTPAGSYADDPQELHLNNLCHAPGWKTGGWTRWSPTDPVDRRAARSVPLGGSGLTLLMPRAIPR